MVCAGRGGGRRDRRRCTRGAPCELHGLQLCPPRGRTRRTSSSRQNGRSVAISNGTRFGCAASSRTSGVSAGRSTSLNGGGAMAAEAPAGAVHYQNGTMSEAALDKVRASEVRAPHAPHVSARRGHQRGHHCDAAITSVAAISINRGHYNQSRPLSPSVAAMDPPSAPSTPARSSGNAAHAAASATPTTVVRRRLEGNRQLHSPFYRRYHLLIE